MDPEHDPAKAEPIIQEVMSFLPKAEAMPESQQLQQQITKPVSNSDEFIILIVANAFLSHDYEYCLRIAKNDFQFMPNQKVFEGNLLRFASLASFKLFEHAMQAD